MGNETVNSEGVDQPDEIVGWVLNDDGTLTPVVKLKKL